jgi:uncharacterized protein YaaW (UPF0174 family)
MSRPLRALLLSAVVFAGLVVLLGAVEGGLDLSAEDTNRLGVLIVAVAAVAAGAIGAWQVTQRGSALTVAEALATLAPPSVLAWGLALASGAGSVTNIAIAVAGPAGAALGLYLLRAAR